MVPNISQNRHLYKVETAIYIYVRHENACKPCRDPFQGIPLGDAARLHPTPCDTSFEFNGGVDSADVSTVAPNSVCSSLNTVSEDSTSVISCDGNTLRIASANVQTLLPYQESRAYAKNSMDILRSKIQLVEQHF